MFIKTLLVAILLLPLASVASPNTDLELLSEFMLLQSSASIYDFPLENNIGLMIRTFYERIRCGQQKHCKECLSSQNVLNIVKGAGGAVSLKLNETAHDDESTKIEDLARVSVVVLNYLLTYQTSCTSELIKLGYVGSCQIYENCWSQIKAFFSGMVTSGESDSLENIEKILREVKAVYEPQPLASCFSAEKILNEVKTRSATFEVLPPDISAVVLVVNHLLNGECIDVGESVADFLDDIFLHYGDSCGRVITQSGFAKLWNDLQMQRQGEHIDHGVQVDSCSTSRNTVNRKTDHVTTNPITTSSEMFQLSNISTSTDSNNSLYLDSSTTTFQDDSNETEATSDNSKFLSDLTSSLETQTTELPTTIEPHLNSTEDINLYLATNNHQKNEQPTPVFHLELLKEESNLVGKIAATGARVIRHTPIMPEEHHHKNLANECLSSDALLKTFLTKEIKVITSTEFLQLCPALVQQAVSGVCNYKTVPMSSTEITLNATENETTGNISVVIENVQEDIRGNTAYAYLAVTVITLTSFGGLFIFPVVNKPFYPILSAFFLGLAFGTMTGDLTLHIIPQFLGLHSHDEEDEEIKGSFISPHYPLYNVRQMVLLFTFIVLHLLSSIISLFCGNGEGGHGHSHGPNAFAMKEVKPSTSEDLETGEGADKPEKIKGTTTFTSPKICCDMNSTAVVVILADTLHNFADGLAVAVSFVTSRKDGLSTSIAVLFHEIPHEIADFSVLLSTGLSFRKVLILNVLSGLSSYLGLVVGINTVIEWRDWLLAVTAGLFLYVTMAEMLPELRSNSKKEWKLFVAKIFGIFFGYAIMISLSIYESAF